MRLRVVADAAQDQDVVVVVGQRARWQCQQEQADDQRPAHAIKRVDQGCHAGIRESCEPSRNTVWQHAAGSPRSEEHTSELQSLMRISYAVFCLKKKNQTQLSRTIIPVAQTNALHIS